MEHITFNQLIDLLIGLDSTDKECVTSDVDIHNLTKELYKLFKEHATTTEYHYVDDDHVNSEMINQTIESAVSNELVRMTYKGRGNIIIDREFMLMFDEEFPISVTVNDNSYSLHIGDKYPLSSRVCDMTGG